MWLCETHLLEHPVWENTTESVHMLLGKLQKHLECKHLKNYFLDGMNLIEGLSCDVETAILSIKYIRRNLLFYVPVSFPERVNEIMTGCCIATEFINVFCQHVSRGR